MNQGRKYGASVGITPRLSGPLRGSRGARVDVSRASTWVTIRRACATTSCPIGVSEMDLALRSISVVPRYSSSFLIWVLMVGCDT